MQFSQSQGYGPDLWMFWPCIYSHIWKASQGTLLHISLIWGEIYCKRELIHLALQRVAFIFNTGMVIILRGGLCHQKESIRTVQKVALIVRSLYWGGRKARFYCTCYMLFQCTILQFFLWKNLCALLTPH